MACSFELEEELRAEGWKSVAGVDEAGRGPLAGPVTAGAVILPEGFDPGRLNDSKKLTENARELLYETITSNREVIWASGTASVEEIDEINILNATYLAMARAIEGLSKAADLALVDGKPVKGLPVPQKAVIKGDGLSFSIAAASIIAKVERDRLMRQYAKEFPEYGFEKHKGYGTKVHLESLQTHGVTPIHRRSFRPIAELAGETS